MQQIHSLTINAVIDVSAHIIIIFVIILNFFLPCKFIDHDNDYWYYHYQYYSMCENCFVLRSARHTLLTKEKRKMTEKLLLSNIYWALNVLHHKFCCCFSVLRKTYTIIIIIIIDPFFVSSLLDARFPAINVAQNNERNAKRMKEKKLVISKRAIVNHPKWQWEWLIIIIAFRSRIFRCFQLSDIDYSLIIIIMIYRCRFRYIFMTQNCW